MKKSVVRKQYRKKIPDNVKLKLWAASGGRCEFPGCNKQVWSDELTLKCDNFAHMAHIVAASSNGPRGDQDLSSQLDTDFSNLMLVCLTHSKLVDGENKNDFNIEYLQKYKKEHEERIEMQTSVSPDMKTTVVRFVTNIRERKMTIPTSQAYEAILPRFPSDSKGVSLDFTNLPGSGDESHWNNFAQNITTQVQQGFAPGNDHSNINHLSIFAIGPIPLLMHLGNRIGGSTSVDIYQKHRDVDDWKWKDEPDSGATDYLVSRSDVEILGTKVALILSLSGKIHVSEVDKVLPNTPRYEIAIPIPDRDYLQYRSQLEKFAKVYRQLLMEIREKHGSDCEIHLFPAVPVSVAVTCGKELLPKVDPKIHVYDFDNERGGFISTLTIN